MRLVASISKTYSFTLETFLKRALLTQKIFSVRGSKGELDLWLNIWKPNSASDYYQKIGRIASGTGTPNKVLADLNNDGVSFLLHISRSL